MKALLLTCAEGHSIDQGTNRISIFNLIEDINAPAFPAILPMFNIAVMLERTQTEPAQLQVQLIIRLDSQTPIIDTMVPIDFQTHLKARAVMQMTGMPIPAPGVLTATIRFGNSDLESWKMNVNQIGTSVVVAPAAGSGRTTPPSPMTTGTGGRPSRTRRSRRP